MAQSLTVKAGEKIRLRDFDPEFCGSLDKETARRETVDHIARLIDLTYRLYAENRRALLLVLQGMDTSGKDGTIRHVMNGVNPQTCQVYSFKQPSVEELDHDFLWRVHRQTPCRGNVGIFNRSHYEDVLVVRVHNLVPQNEWSQRYDQINVFERLLTDAGTTLVKVFLHISKKEQKQRLMQRLEDPTRRWKFSTGDLAERKLWNEYQEAYEDALTKCNTKHAPWYIVPANRKWYRDFVISKLLADTLTEMDPQFPPPEPGLDQLVIE